ncbi:MAG TPA: hypothetical protein VD704_08725 [Gaiellaceae bacterium]|nr:hypothetical protein [Gaiellaceae bacterium]
MRPVNTILDRFRRAAAVPAAAGDELARELAPLFAALDGIEQKGEKLRVQAERAAERRLAGARADAARIEAAARKEAESERVRAEVAARRAAAAESEAVLARAEADAGRIREAGAARIPPLVAEVVACVRGEEP